MRVPIAVFVVSLVPILASPQSLGDAARGAASRREAQPAAKPFTDDDLRSRHVVETGAPPSPSDGAAASPAAKAGVEPRSPRSSVNQDAEPAAKDPVRERLDREAEERRGRDQSWKQGALALVERLRSAQRSYQAACAPQAVTMAGG